MQRVMAEIQQLGTLDKAAQDKLMEDLKQTDPSLWPLVIQQFRAAVAYRRQAEQRRDSPASPAALLGQQVSQAEAAPDERPIRLPPINDTALAPAVAPPDNYPSTPHPPAEARQGKLPIEDRSPAERAGQVVNASYDLPAGDWQTSLEGAIRALESAVSKTPQTQDDIARHVRLRLLYLSAGRRDAAIQPIPAAPPATQEFWSKELYGLATWLDTQRTADAERRAAETKRILDEALCRLGEAAPLVIRNLAFCTEVHSFGCIKPFRANEFAPDQEVLLYAEVENFTSEPTPKGFHTRLRSSYQVFDSRGQRVAEQDFPISEEYCQNPRRDFFIGYHVRLPSRIYPGKHTLQLTIEDLKSQKGGQGSIELSIKEAVAERKR